MGRPFQPRHEGRRPRQRPGAASSFVATIALLSVATFLIVFQTDVGGAGRPAGSLVRARPASVSAPFPNCNAARAAGAAPVYRGDPGYAEHLDGDLDGIGCEPYRRR